ncbi:MULTISPECIES: invasion associated locus B family protein [Brucella]|uniref:Uncharacterized protein n=1 Tax=Brucella inopinata TaxID=1218315 RepID=A0AAW7B119_9HYPH|nr:MULTISPECIES: hypothetical protein [Brucella]KEY03663.1 hypothetical protein IL59_0215260 [Brucella suis bv. 4 str. 40]MDL2332815.1 hypothetical protein [Brucella inopinata]QPN27441.1 hypothetical protein I5770_01980 [Brucella sp. BO2]QTO00400.1 hypothetical protein J8E27_11740 [Brucella sp. 458]
MSTGTQINCHFKIAAQRIGGPEITFSVSLKGFVSGFERIAALDKQKQGHLIVRMVKWLNLF